MLNENDIAWIKANRREIVEGRQRPITIAYEGAGTPDPITGEVTGGEWVERDMQSVVTEISGGEERVMVGGIRSERGDIWLSLDFDAVADIADKIDRVRYDGVWHAVVASDKKGIGLRNRVELLGRVIT